MVRAGASWSGRERNCVFLNTGEMKFINISGMSGLDWQDDGRALAVADWDRDGDLDLWFKNRTGPQIRYMENTGPTGNFVSLTLIGKSDQCNADAIGARVEVWSSGRQRVQTVQAGTGYLAQSSKRLHFGLADDSEIDRIVVHWPGGVTETLPTAEVGFHYRYVQESKNLQPLEPLTSENSPGSKSVDNRADSSQWNRSRGILNSRMGQRIVLREPVPLPEKWLDEKTQFDQGFTLITFWAEWCPHCRAELISFGQRAADLHSGKIQIMPLNLDESQDQAKARQVAAKFGLAGDYRAISQSQSTLIAAILRSALDIHGDLPIPMSWLLDSEGQVITIYRGSVSVDDLLGDCQELKDAATGPGRDSHGRWYARPGRRFTDLVNELKDAGLLDWARFYLKLDRQSKSR